MASQSPFETNLTICCCGSDERKSYTRPLKAVMQMNGKGMTAAREVTP